jgi:hypothetical protein
LLTQKSSPRSPLPNGEGKVQNCPHGISCVVDESAIKEGVLKTLWAFGVLEKVKDDRKLDIDTDVKQKVI